MTPGTIGNLPTVSVIVPCYNYGRYLPDCIRSILEQEGVAVRALIIDDASSDGSARVAATLADREVRIEVRVHSENQGHIQTYNEGLRWADGDYTVLLDADDMLTPGSLQRACALLDARPEVGFVYGRCVVFRDDRPRPLPRDGAARWKIWPGSRWLEERCRTANNCIHCPEVVARTSLLRRVGGYRPELPHSADFELWMRLAAYADVGFIRGPHQAYYRVHPMSMQRERFGTVLARLPQAIAAFDLLFRHHGASIVERVRLQAMARHTLARQALIAACRAYDRGESPLSDVDTLVQFAYATDPGASLTGERRGLRWRQQLGPRMSRLLWPLLPPATIPRLARRLRREVLSRVGL